MVEFIKWDGGEQPVPSLSVVHVRYRDNPEIKDDERFYAQELDWVHDPECSDDDIVEYAVADNQPVFLVWYGGENPAPGKTVEVVLRGSSWVLQSESSVFDWTHEPDDSDSDIFLYRVVSDA